MSQQVFDAMKILETLLAPSGFTVEKISAQPIYDEELEPLEIDRGTRITLTLVLPQSSESNSSSDKS